MVRAPVICLSHGAGPMPLLGHPSHKEMISSWENRVRKILQLGTPDEPQAIVLVSAHFSKENPTISSGKSHKLYYDYYNMPPAAYTVKYDAPGSPQIAREIYDRLKQAGLSPTLDEERGWDHGVFIPMKLIIPDESIPIVQMSVLQSEDPAAHFMIGSALAGLRDLKVAIIGSGFASLHNTSLLRNGTTQSATFQSEFHEWAKVLEEAVSTEEPEMRLRKLSKWRQFPHSYTMHPRGGAEHFLPLLVCASAGGLGKAKYYADRFMGIEISTFFWD